MHQKIIEAIRALKSQLSAKQQYDSITQTEGLTYSPIKRLELFLSCALKGQDWIDVEPFLADLTAQLDPRDEALRLAQIALGEVQDLIGESKGVYGLHLNGDVAPWGDVEQGGFFERLSTLPEALAAIDEVMKGKP